MATINIRAVMANFTATLAAKMSAAAGALTLSRSTDDDGNTLTSTFWITLDEGTNSEEHMIVTFVGAAGTVVLRGLSRVDAQTEVADNKLAHERGAGVTITNMSLVAIMRLLNGTDTFNAVDWIGVQSIDGLATPGAGETTKAANIEYVNNIAIAGSPDASDVTKGILKLSVAAAAPANPISVGDNDPRVPTADENAALVGTSGAPSGANPYVTADDVATAGASKVLRTKANALVDESVLGLTTAGDVLFSNGTNPVRLAIGTSKQALIVNVGATAPKWAAITNKVSVITTAIVVASSTSQTTVYSVLIPAGTLKTNNCVRVRIYCLFEKSSAAGAQFIMRMKYGGTTIIQTSTLSGLTMAASRGYVDMLLFGNAATDAQKGSLGFTTQVNDSLGNTYHVQETGAAAEDSMVDLNLVLTVQFGASTATDIFTATHSVTDVITNLL